MWNENNEPVTSVVSWVNTSAVYYPKETLQSDVPEFLYTYAVKGKAVYDMALGYYFFRSRIPIYIIHPAMINNYGNEYTAMGHPEKRSHDDYSAWKFYVDRS